MSLGIVRRTPLQVRYSTSWSSVISSYCEWMSGSVSGHRCHGTATTSETLKTEAIKAFDEVPVFSVSLMTLLQVFVRPKLRRQMRKYQIQDMVEKFRKYGPIYRTKIGRILDMVYINDAKAVEQIMDSGTKDGQYPKRFPITPWIAYREMKGLSPGILTA